MTIQALFFFTAVTAFGGLAIDVQRVYGVHGQMQAFVDNVALASAAELDGLTTGNGAIVRGVRAAVGSGTITPLVTGSQNFTTNPPLRVQKITFLSSLDNDPGPRGTTPTTKEQTSYVLCTYVDNTDDGTANGSYTQGAGCPNTLTNIRTANFVEIVAVPRTVNYLVLPIVDAVGQFFGAGPVVSQALVSVRATAGYLVEVCNNIPLMFCNPNEAGGATGANFVPLKGQMYYAGIRTGPLTPGDFALIEAFAGKGADEIREAMARVNPNTFCFSRVTRKPGIDAGPVSQGMNVRFDVYDGNMAKNNKDGEYRPAPNVLKGYVPNGGACSINWNNGQSNDSIPFPRDNCFMAKAPGGAGSGCTMVDEGKGPIPKMGNGYWARAEYMSQNHPELVGGPMGQMGGFNYIDGKSPVGGWTRYDTYRWEIENKAIVDNAKIDEKGAPACYNSPGNPVSTDPDFDRRVITAAVVNCIADIAQLEGGNAKGVRTKIYAKLFITEPVNSVAWDTKNIERPAGLQWKAPPSQQGMWAEMIGTVQPNEETLHVYPVLYR